MRACSSKLGILASPCVPKGTLLHSQLGRESEMPSVLTLTGGDCEALQAGVGLLSTRSRARTAAVSAAHRIEKRCRKTTGVSSVASEELAPAGGRRGSDRSIPRAQGKVPEDEGA